MPARPKVAIAAVIGLLFTSLATLPAQAGTPPTSDEYADIVAAFASEFPQPQLTAKEGSANWNEQNVRLAEYWSSAPWDAAWGQWGYTLLDSGSGLTVGEDGILRATWWGVVEGSAGLDGIEAAMPGLVPRDEASRSGVGILSNSCRSIGSGYHCLSNASSTVSASYRWDGGGTITGSVRLAQPGVGQPCSGSPQLAATPFTNLSSGNTAIVYAASNSNSQFANSFWTGTGLRSRHCAVL